MFGFWFLNKWTMGVAALALYTGAVAFYVHDHVTDKVDRARLKATIKQLEERGEIDADVSNTDITELCIELGGVPVDCRE